MKSFYWIAGIISALFVTSSLGGAITKDRETNHKHMEDYVQKQTAKYSDKQIYVHLISHTHDDVGWLKTVDEYFTGSYNGIAHAGVFLIIDTVVDELLADSNKRFTYVEMKFFTMWWNEQSEERKDNVRGLVQEGRLEFVNAGWSMHDEACAYYEDMINNMMYGHQFLLKEFGVKPRIGWHVDPFGHSNANPRLFADMGFDAWFFARLDREDKQQRFTDKAMEFIWRPFYSHLGNTTQIFTHAMYDHYCYPGGFDYDDRFYGQDPLVVSPELDNFNADDKVQQMLERIYDMLDVYQGNNLLITMGCDFTFANARMNFISTDRLISYFNSHVDNITLMYSTPGLYLDALKAQNESYPLKYDDIFPYSDGPTDFWTGYFTSRANSKKQIRDGQANLHASSKLYSLRILDQNITDTEVQQIINVTSEMLDAQGINQHHDGITGTAKQHVANDYVDRIYKAVQNNNRVYSDSMNKMIEQYTQITNAHWTWCDKLNGTYLDCPISQHQDQDLILAVHNPTVFDQYFFKVKVSHGNYTISRWNSTTSVFDLVDQASVICSNKTVKTQVTQTIVDCDMHIKAQMMASDFTIFKVHYNTSADLTIKETTGDIHLISGNNETLNYTGTDDEGVRFDLIKNITGKTYKVAFDLRYYVAMQTSAIFGGSNSGAYIFRPDQLYNESIQYGTLKEIKSFDGGFVKELQMTFVDKESSEVAQVNVRYYDGSQSSIWEVNLAGILGSILLPVGKEVTVNWKSFDIKNNKTFYTDSNGLEMQKRIIDYRSSYNYTPGTQNISSNYYPVNSAIAIVDEEAKLQMTVMNDRSQGGSVIDEGKIELMQNRRMFFDDSRGVDEALNEADQYGYPISVPATYRLSFLERDTGLSNQRKTQLFVDEPLQYFFAFNWTDGLQQSYESENKLEATIGKVIDFKYSLFPLERNKISIRVENIGDRFDTDHLNLTMNDTTIAFELNAFCEQLFQAANLHNPQVKLLNVTFVETSLTGNQEYSEMVASKTYWKTQGEGMIGQIERGRVVTASPVDYQDFTTIDLSQQRIRTFNATFYAQDSSMEPKELIFLS